MKPLHLHPLPSSFPPQSTATSNNQPFSAGAPLLFFRFPHLPRISCVFTTALHGNLSLDVCTTEEERASTRTARRALATLPGLSSWSELHQVHGTTLVLNPDATPVEEASTLDADGQATEAAGLGLIVKTADCQPVLLAHKHGHFIAGLHVGWRGNAADFIRSAVENMCEHYKTKPADVLAVRGPSLGPGHAEFIHFEKEWGADFAPWFNQRSKTMHLWALTRHQLTQAGLLPESIFGLDLCTYALAPWFFSHRQGHRGRQMSLIYKI